MNHYFKKITKGILLIGATFVSFILFFEILSYQRLHQTFLRPAPQKIDTVTRDLGPKAYLIGDSYAETGYLKDGFPKKFKRYFDSTGYYFQNLSSSASELNAHIDQFRALKDIHPELIIYFYNINDIVSIDANLFAGVDTEKVRLESNTTNTSKPNLFAYIRMYSSSFILVKDVMHLLCATFTGRPFPGSTVYQLPQSHITHREELTSYFQEFATYTDQLVIVVNTPMNYGAKPQKWDHYTVLNAMNLSQNTTLIHAIDIIGHPSHAVSWRNGHYNQKGVNKLYEHISTLISIPYEFRSLNEKGRCLVLKKKQ